MCGTTAQEQHKQPFPIGPLMDLQLLWLREPKEFDLAEHDNCAA